MWFGQKNGSIVRRLVGYGKLCGMDAMEALGSAYRFSRLYVNFQPLFKLKSKTRLGARVTKRYETPLTPLERVLRSSAVPGTTKCALREGFHALDPVRSIFYVGCAKGKGVWRNVAQQVWRLAKSRRMRCQLRTSWRVKAQPGRMGKFVRRTQILRRFLITRAHVPIRSNTHGRRYNDDWKLEPGVRTKQ